MSTLPSKQLPPGRTGLPLAGETLAFLANGYDFISRRRAEHGPVFRTSILFRPTAVISGPGAGAVWIDPSKIQRADSMPPNIQAIFGGRSLPLLDGAEHRERKLQVLAGFSRDALGVYLSQLEPIVQSSLARWCDAGEISGVLEMKRLAIEGICRNVFGLEPGPATDGLRADYGLLTAGVTALPIPLPGTAYRKGLDARDRIFRTFDDLIRRHRRAPEDDGLSRILAAAPDGRTISDSDARLEIHHAVIAGYIIFAELVTAILELHRNPDVLGRLRDEIRREAPEGAVSPLRGMTVLHEVVLEVKRLCPILPALFGRAKSTFELDGFSIPAGWMVLFALRETHLDSGVYREPAKFDPDRFSPERAEDRKVEHGYVPHGPGSYEGHKCPGTDYATLFMELFLVELVRGYRWEFPPQNLAFDWKKTPPEPKDGLLMKLSRA